jgi:nucleoside-diphosphate-sugar epimerase
MKVLVTGGTGFVGQSLLAYLSFQNDGNDYYFVGSRTGVRFRESHTETISPWNVLNDCPFDPDFDAVLHAATPASASLNATDPLKMVDIIVSGTQNVLKFVTSHKYLPRFILVSTGGVYGEMPSSLSAYDENYLGAVATIRAHSAYAEAKRMSEVFASISREVSGVDVMIARLFAFSGPHLPRDRHFAVGNFVRDAVQNNCIQVKSDGQSVRSYLDERDMAGWLLAILQRGQSGEVYHVGSERSITIGELAHLTAERYSIVTGNRCAVEILGQVSSLDGVSRYVPSTKRTRHVLGTCETISLEESLDSMILSALKSEGPA